MEERNIHCYLCGNKVIEQSNYDTARTTIIDCNEPCKPYETTTESRLYYFEKEGKLTEEMKGRIIEYLNQYFKGAPIRLTTSLVQHLAGE